MIPPEIPCAFPTTVSNSWRFSIWLSSWNSPFGVWSSPSTPSSKFPEYSDLFTRRLSDSRSAQSFTKPETSTWAPMKYRIVPRLSQSGAHIRRFMKGDPSRRLEQVCQSQLNHGLRGHVLVEKHFTMLETSLDFLANSSDAGGFVFGP